MYSYQNLVLSCMMKLGYGTMVRYGGTMVRYDGAVRRYGAVQWCSGTMVNWCNGTRVHYHNQAVP